MRFAEETLEGQDDLPPDLQRKLNLLACAYKEFWAKKDPNQRETHPKNPEVSEWLVKNNIEKDISNSQAIALTSFIRPKWAGTGRLPEL